MNNEEILPRDIKAACMDIINFGKNMALDYPDDRCSDMKKDLDDFVVRIVTMDYYRNGYYTGLQLPMEIRKECYNILCFLQTMNDFYPEDQCENMMKELQKFINLLSSTYVINGM